MKLQIITHPEMLINSLLYLTMFILIIRILFKFKGFYDRWMQILYFFKALYFLFVAFYMFIISNAGAVEIINHSLEVRVIGIGTNLLIVLYFLLILFNTRKPLKMK